MSTIARWAVQGVALFLFAWMAAVAGQWNSAVVDQSSSERLAQLGDFPAHDRKAAVASAE